MFFDPSSVFDPMSDTPVSHSRNVHSLQDTIAKIVDMEHELDRDIDALVDLKRDMTRLIKEVKNPQYQLILECAISPTKAGGRLRSPWNWMTAMCISSTALPYGNLKNIF